MVAASTRTYRKTLAIVGLREETRPDQLVPVTLEPSRKHDLMNVPHAIAVLSVLPLHTLWHVW